MFVKTAVVWNILIGLWVTETFAQPVGPVTDYTVGWANNCVKIRREDFSAVLEAGPIRLEAARNEKEAFQVIVRSGAPLDKVDLYFTDLVAANGKDRITRMGNFECFLEYYHRVTRTGEDREKVQMPGFPPWTKGAVEYWPDALVPYKAFAVGKKSQQAVWVELAVPANQPAGNYHGKIFIIPGNGSVKAMELELTVWDFALPTTPTFHLMSMPGVMTTRWGKVDNITEGSTEFRRLYTKRLLWYLDHGISGGLLASEAMTPEDWMPLKHWPVGLEHEAYFTHPKCTTYELTFDEGDWTDPKRQARLKQSLAFIRARSWDKNKTFIIRTDDEPGADRFGKLKQQAKVVHTVDKDIKTLLTLMNIEPKMSGGVDIWCPIFYVKDDVGWIEKVRQRKAAGEEVWFYANAFTFPIDVAGIHNRLQGFIAARYGFTGEYFFALNWWWTDKGYIDPFNEIRSKANEWNGGSWLAYPGYKFGTDDLLGSIRLSLIREWAEDYEYFARLKTAMKAVREQLSFKSLPYLEEDRAWEIANPVVRTAYDYTTNTSLFFQTRRQLAEEILHTGQSPLILVAMNPRANSMLKDKIPPVVRIEGAVESGATVTVGEKKTAVDEQGRFSTSVKLQPGENTINLNVKKGAAAKTLVRKILWQPSR